MPNRRISELDESGPLYFSDVTFNTYYTENTGAGNTDEWFLMLARPKVSNEKVSIPNFHRSILNDAVYLNGDQRISGQKIFKNKCYITKRANIHEIQDLSQDGPISGYGFVGISGLFERIIAGTGDPDAGDCDINVYGDAAFEDTLKISESISFPGEFKTTSDFTALDIRADGETSFTNGFSSTGDAVFSGESAVSSNGSFGGDITNCDNLHARENILAPNNQKLVFTSDRIQFISGTSNFIDVQANNIQIKDTLNINSANFVNVSSSTPSGKIYVEGTGYSENINALNNGTYRSFFGGDDESMVFKSYLQSGYNNFTISLPKTFLEQPIISTNLQHLDNGTIIPYIISDVNQNQFQVKFGENINDNNFVLHTTVMAPSSGEYTSNKKGFQRFKTLIPSGTNSQTIAYPETHNASPTVALNIEGQNEIVPYAISGVNTTNYTIFFAADTQEDYILHTISTEHSNQRIS
jgi:hypothetical protein